jgi:uncharacterized membrane protein
MALLGVIAFMPFVTAYVSSNITQRVPTIAYCTMMLLAALLNLKVNRTATSPPMVDEAADPEAVRYVRQRGFAVMLGSATAVGISVVAPEIGQMGLISIPLWRVTLVRLGRRRKPA